MKSRIFLPLCVTFFVFQSVCATVNWAGGDITLDVTNDNINLSGDNFVCSDILVAATTQNIIISVSADARLIGKVTSGAPRLALFVDAGYSITFLVNNNLKFIGDPTVPLLVTVKGDGVVRFILSDNKKCEITSVLPGNTGTRFFIITRTNPKSSVEVLRSSSASNNNVELTVGAESILSFAAEDAINGLETSGGDLLFNPVNSGAGRMIVRIEDSGCVLIQGNKIPVGVAQRNLLISDFDLAVPAGSQISCNLEGSVSSIPASLLFLNENSLYPDLLSDPWNFGMPVSNRYGCIVGPNGNINTSGNVYLDYVGLTNNICSQSFAKPRNASALIMDGIADDFATTATFSMTAPSGIFFRSGVASDGSVSADFTVDPTKTATGAGNVLFDVEGRTVIEGSGLGCAFEIMSLQTNPVGGSVVIDYGSPFIFPLRTFARDVNNMYLCYNTGCCLINNALSLTNVDLVHSDENHTVYPCNAELSEPTYIGGESFTLESPIGPRPSITMKGARVKFHTSAAFTGVDFSVVAGNPTTFTFFYNGRLIDDGVGRTLMLGTQIGSMPCDITLPVISTDANLILAAEPLPGPQQLLLQVAPNDATITQGITGDISNQFSTHVVCLGNGSFIEVGIQGIPLFPSTTPTFTIDGKYFSFETKVQGDCCSGCGGEVTGIGTIFVDNQGVINITSGIRANIRAMVLKSGNGSVQLPMSQVRFAPQVGISHRTLDLTDPTQRVIISFTENLSDYTLNWQDVIKGYASIDFPFIPYALDVYPPFGCPAVTIENISSLPTVQGKVEQFQIIGSRLGDEAYLMVDGGTIYELIFLDDCGPATVEGAVVVVQNGAYVGLGSRDRDQDSERANIVLGVNGVTLIPNGNARIELNEDVIINDICHVLAGPDFGLEGTQFDPDFNPADLRVSMTQVLEIHSDLGKSIIVKSGGQLDLTSFTSAHQTLAFSGNANLILEPGAQILMNGGTLLMTDKAKVITHTVP